jgi:hypothetical protein
MRKKQVAFTAKSQKHIAVAPHLKERGQITPFDITKPVTFGATVGVQFVSFSYVDVGGTDNLLPGFINTQTASLTWPRGAGYAVIMLRGFTAAYVDENDDLVDHHLGQLLVNLYFKDDDTVACDFLLRDQGTSEGVNMSSDGLVLYFQG